MLTYRDIDAEFRQFSPGHGHMMSSPGFTILLEAQIIIRYKTAESAAKYLFEKLFVNRLICIGRQIGVVDIYLPSIEKSYVSKVIIPGIKEILLENVHVTYNAKSRRLRIKR